MKLLAIDTTTSLSSVALSIESRMLCKEQGLIRQHAQLLLPMIKEMLDEAGLSVKQLDGIIFGRGPGSFTGLRIACSVAKALAYAHDLPVYPVSSLAAIAYEAFNRVEQLPPQTQVLAMIDARMQQVYWAYYLDNTAAKPERVTDPHEVDVVQSPVLLAGSGFEPYLALLPPLLQKNLIRQMAVFPHARSMIHLVQSGCCQPVSAAEALPVYVRNQVTQGETRG
ncbi:tRNA (adenosine(37)-N6)-threonylcarbamoyltransferase complex dimerization subunit type 1 TsaB [Legionella londiniensis]|uniref:tRNA threonylcarbamoyladenosine biosynthesis protein TsaB n=1 Tax=Legionella londiniensis TaxID=45068 RepID=A0A0W0VPF5_9GAMM|nr:tRNA (adenosine(37)-N6)-threonylcarbamoyltransferase complex dimerization subunit type 1 TsaB [Legionella londiniensis]KTD21939.1 glycoprotease [Legionella londiniensis]STX92578.1 glycoprotease [Legionella londiniensis]